MPNLTTAFLSISFNMVVSLFVIAILFRSISICVKQHNSSSTAMYIATFCTTMAIGLFVISFCLATLLLCRNLYDGIPLDLAISLVHRNRGFAIIKGSRGLSFMLISSLILNIFLYIIICRNCTKKS